MIKSKNSGADNYIGSSNGSGSSSLPSKKNYDAGPEPQVLIMNRSSPSSVNQSTEEEYAVRVPGPLRNILQQLGEGAGAQHWWPR